MADKTLLEKLQEKRLKAVHDAREIVERSIDGDMSGEDEAAYTKANEAIDRYGNLINEEVKRSEAEAEKHEGFDAAVRRAGVKREDVEERDDDGKPKPKRGDIQKRMTADLAEKRGGGAVDQAIPEWRDMLAGTANKGAEVIPVTLVERIYSKMFDHSAILDAGVSIIRTSSGETMKFPRLTALNPLTQSNSRVAEGGPLQEADPSLDQVQLDAYKYGQFAQISRELVSDGVADVEGLMAFILSRNIADNLGIDLTNGSGSGQPRGIRTLIAAGSQKVNSAGGGLLSTTSFDDYFDVMSKVHRSYRKNGKWLVNDATIFTLRKVKMNGVYAWEPNLQGAGNPDSFCGYPVLIDQNVPVPAASAGITLIFGDFSAYMVRLVGDVRVEWSTEYAWVNDLLSVKAVLRGDGDAIDDAAFAGFNSTA